MEKTSGIYLIKIDKYYYIGSSNNINKRFKRHLSELKRNNHFNKFLQNLYNKHKEYNFFLLETCEEENLLKIEQDYIDIYYNEKYCVNLTKSVSAVMRGRVFSLEHRRNLSIASKRQKMSEEHKEKLRQLSIGRKWNENQKNKCRRNPKNGKDNFLSKPIELCFLDGNIKTYECVAMAAKELNVNYKTITGWINGNFTFPGIRPVSQRRGQSVINGRFLR